MRLISQSDISKLYQDKIENIIKDFCDSYADKSMLMNNNFNIDNGEIDSKKKIIFNNIESSDVRLNKENTKDYLVNGKNKDSNEINLNNMTLDLEGKIFK